MIEIQTRFQARRTAVLVPRHDVVPPLRSLGTTRSRRCVPSARRGPAVAFTRHDAVLQLHSLSTTWSRRWTRSARQLAVAAGQGAADVALLGLGELMHEIAVATESLAAAIAHGETGATPHQRRIQATVACAKTFGWAAESLVWLIEEGGNGAERETAVACLATLRELTLRYPAMKRTNPPVETTIAAPPASVH